jgi:hypothetical protein
MLFIFSTPVLSRHLWQLKTVVFLRWFLICAVPFKVEGLRPTPAAGKRENYGILLSFLVTIYRTNCQVKNVL